MPAIGAMAKGDGNSTEPIFIALFYRRERRARRENLSAIFASSAVPS
jgi:hypothetical protein